MSWIESRIGLAETSIEDLRRRLLDLARQVTANAQGLRSAGQALPPPAQGGGGAGYYGCVITGGVALAAGGPGAPLTGQTVWQISGGARAYLAGTQTLYNDTPNAIAPGKQVLLAANPDGSFTAIGVPC